MRNQTKAQNGQRQTHILLWSLTSTAAPTIFSEGRMMKVKYEIRQIRDAEGRRCYKVDRAGHDEPATQLFYSRAAARMHIVWLEEENTKQMLEFG
jgi:hypothetical protein